MALRLEEAPAPIHIYTAAEIAFDTEIGRSYQIQAISNLGGGWQPVGAPIPGTGQAMSYVTPTRSKAHNSTIGWYRRRKPSGTDDRDGSERLTTDSAFLERPGFLLGGCERAQRADSLSCRKTSIATTT